MNMFTTGNLESDFRTLAISYQKMFEKDLKSFKAFRDFYRLARNISIEIEEQDESVVIYDLAPDDGIKEDDLTTRVVKILNGLSQSLNEIAPQFDCFHEDEDEDRFLEPKTTVEELKKKVHDFNHYDVFTRFFLEKYGETSNLIKLIKFTHQGFVINMLSSLTMRVYKQMGLRFKDYKGDKYPRWKVIFRFSHNPEKPFVTVIHRRTEQMMGKAQSAKRMSVENLFTFTWEMRFAFNSFRMKKIDSISAEILNVDWDAQTVKMYPKKAPEVQLRDIFGRPHKDVVVNDYDDSGRMRRVREKKDPLRSGETPVGEPKGQKRAKEKQKKPKENFRKNKICKAFVGLSVIVTAAVVVYAYWKN